MRSLNIKPRELKELRAKIELETCPPRVLYSVNSSDQENSQRFTCKITIEGATVSETQDEAYFTTNGILPPCTSASAASGSKCTSHIYDYYSYTSFVKFNTRNAPSRCDGSIWFIFAVFLLISSKSSLPISVPVVF